MGIGIFMCSDLRTQERNDTSRSGLAFAGLGVGTIVVEMWDGLYGRYNFWIYKIQSPDRLVHLEVAEKKNGPKFSSTQKNNVSQPVTYSKPACDSPLPVLSSSMKLSALCKVGVPSGLVGNRQESIVITDTNSGSLLYEWKKQGRYVEQVIWSPNSDSIAILNSTYHFRVDPLNVFIALSGHPVSYYTAYLDVVDVRTGMSAEYKLRGGIKGNLYSKLLWNVDDAKATGRVSPVTTPH